MSLKVSRQDRTPHIILAAGGTGGHLFPAQAVGEVLKQRGCTVSLVSDTRAARYIDKSGVDVYLVSSGTVMGRGLLGKLMGVLALLKGTYQCLSLMSVLRPSIVVGFGGYPTVPPLCAAFIRGIPTVIHEANAVIGRANRFLAPRAKRIAMSFPLEEANSFAPKSILTGVPVRESVIQASKDPFVPFDRTGRFKLLVFGGSQGAKIMAQIIPEAIERLSLEQRSRIELVQQAHAEDVDALYRRYENAKVQVEISSFFSDLPQRMGGAHLVISRSGASTCAEIAVIGRPSILVPLPGSIDQDQMRNAESLAKRGAALVQPQSDFTSEWLAEKLTQYLEAPALLAMMAGRARSVGIADAAERLALLICEAL